MRELPRRSVIMIRNKPSFSTASRAFTLVELLVVIGIIAVLISFLMPALSKARQSVKKVNCASNMRQTYLGLYLYANENKGWFPRSPNLTSGGSAITGTYFIG